MRESCQVFNRNFFNPKLNTTITKYPVTKYYRHFLSDLYLTEIENPLLFMAKG